LRKKQFTDSRKNKKGSSNNKSVSKPESDVKEQENDGEEDKDEKVSAPAKVHNPMRCEGAVLKLKGIDKNTNFSAIKKVFVQHGKVAYVETVNDNLEVIFRFNFLKFCVCFMLI